MNPTPEVRGNDVAEAARLLLLISKSLGEDQADKVLKSYEADRIAYPPDYAVPIEGAKVGDRVYSISEDDYAVEEGVILAIDDAGRVIIADFKKERYGGRFHDGFYWSCGRNYLDRQEAIDACEVSENDCAYHENALKAIKELIAMKTSRIGDSR